MMGGSEANASAAREVSIMLRMNWGVVFAFEKENDMSRESSVLDD